MKVTVEGKEYCVETLISENEQLLDQLRSLNEILCTPKRQFAIYGRGRKAIYYCGRCHAIVSFKAPYCKWCGQQLMTNEEKWLPELKCPRYFEEEYTLHNLIDKPLKRVDDEKLRRH